MTAFLITEIARSDRQWTRVAVSKEGRMFVCYPRWSDRVKVSVEELLPSGEVWPYPDAAWNDYSVEDPKKKFVCVQSVYCDDEDKLWILDPGNPKLEGVVSGGAKLIKVDLETDKVEVKYYFHPPTITRRSYLNDVRVDTKENKAYITDSNEGAIIVVDLTKDGEDSSQHSRRLLERHYSVKAERVVLTIEGREWRPNGETPRVHSDGIALSWPDHKHLYYQALTGRTLYRIPTAALNDPKVTPKDLADKVERVCETGAADGIEFGRDGYLYLTAIEKNAITRVHVESGRLEMVALHDNFVWPDSIACHNDGSLYVTTSQINRVSMNSTLSDPFRLFHLQPVQIADWSVPRSSS